MNSPITLFIESEGSRKRLLETFESIASSRNRRSDQLLGLDGPRPPREQPDSSAPQHITMKTIGKFGLAAVAAGAFWAATLPSKAETADTFTRHGLPIPGAYFKSKESQKPSTVAVSKSATTWPRYEPLLGTALSIGRSSALRSANNMTNTERNRRKRHRLRGEAIVA